MRETEIKVTAEISSQNGKERDCKELLTFQIVNKTKEDQTKRRWIDEVETTPGGYWSKEAYF